MLDFQQKWKTKTFMYSRGVRIFLMLLVLYSLFSTYTVYEKKRQSEKDVKEAEKELLALSSKNNILIEDIDRLQTDEGLEAEIRSKYSVAKGDEQVVVLVEEDSHSTTKTEIKLPFWTKVRLFLGL